MVDVRLVEVDARSWRACPALCLCAYGDTWHPLAIEVDDKVVGFLMWGVDEDASRWIGGPVVDVAHQRRGIARATVVQAVRLLVAQEGCTGVALSYGPDNQAARSLYAGLGFAQTGETVEEGAEVVSRLSLPDAHALTR